jgi:predicted transposase YbfD/YdcC
VWAGEFGQTLAKVVCEEKSNETTAIPEILKLIMLKNSIITIDTRF